MRVKTNFVKTSQVCRRRFMVSIPFPLVHIRTPTNPHHPNIFGEWIALNDEAVCPHQKNGEYSPFYGEYMWCISRGWISDQTERGEGRNGEQPQVFIIRLAMWS